jgi:predicted HAD superfamily Cof-like phosphohydrolase
VNKNFEQVKEFHRAFDCQVSETPVMLAHERAEMRSGFMLEEIEEFLESENVYEQADAMIDLIYFALGTLVEMGVKPGGIFDIVHEANMSKIWSDGKVHRRESDGKVIKPPEWEDPEPKIKTEIDSMK